MTLLVRAVRFLTLLITRLALSLIAALIRMLLPTLVRILRILCSLMWVSLTATVNGPRQYTDRLAAQWTWWLIDSGVSREYIEEIYSLCRFLVAGVIFLGWTVAALFTVAMLRVVFGLFF